MKIIYTDYADDTIRERDIDKEDIEETLINPDEIVEGKNARKINHKIFKDKLLRVVYEIEEKTYIVITTYYTKPVRYMKK